MTRSLSMPEVLPRPRTRASRARSRVSGPGTAGRFSEISNASGRASSRAGATPAAESAVMAQCGGPSEREPEADGPRLPFELAQHGWPAELCGVVAWAPLALELGRDARALMRSAANAVWLLIALAILQPAAAARVQQWITQETNRTKVRLYELQTQETLARRYGVPPGQAVD